MSSEWSQVFTNYLDALGAQDAVARGTARLGLHLSVALVDAPGFPKNGRYTAAGDCFEYRFTIASWLLSHAISLEYRDECVGKTLPAPTIAASDRSNLVWNNSLPLGIKLKGMPEGLQNGVPVCACRSVMIR